jgi:hypothetical protein
MTHRSFQFLLVVHVVVVTGVLNSHWLNWVSIFRVDWRFAAISCLSHILYCRHSQCDVVGLIEVRLDGEEGLVRYEIA